MPSEPELGELLKQVAERSIALAGACHNEESAKLYLVLPVLGALGYDYSDPRVLKPEFSADFRSERDDRVDFAILRDEKPIIIVECKKVGSDLATDRGQLQSYFAALASVSLGILTDGLRFEFFVDSELENIMDDEPFLTLNIPSIARNGLGREASSALSLLMASRFDAEAVADVAHLHLTRKRLRKAAIEELRHPSEDFCRALLQRLGVKNVRRNMIDEQYRELVKLGFEEALVLPVVNRLRAARDDLSIDIHDSGAGQRIVTSERELAVVRYVRRRLAYLVKDERHFQAIDAVGYRDYVGKLVVYFRNVRKGRLFDYFEGHDGLDRFVFPEPFGEVTTHNLADLDSRLAQVFMQRVKEIGIATDAADKPSERAA